MSGACHFRRDRLPSAAQYYRAEGLRLTGTGEWRSALCPFHIDATPSLRIHMDRGAFRCMACGVNGGDLLDYHRRQHGLGFVEAAKALGAWDGP